MTGDDEGGAAANAAAAEAIGSSENVAATSKPREMAKEPNIQDSKDGGDGVSTAKASLYDPKREFEKLLRDMIDIENADSKAQDLAAKFILLSDDMYRRDSDDKFHMATIGLTYLKSKRYDIAESIYRDLQVKLCASAALGEALHGMLSFIAISISLVFSFFIVRMIIILNNPYMALLYRFDFDATFTGISLRNLVTAGLAGCLGSVVSILLRLSEFERMIGRSRRFLFWTSFSLPIVGGAFGVVVAALLESHVLNLSFGQPPRPEHNLHLFIVIGFLCGFSERLARGLLNTVEGKILGAEAEILELTARRSLRKHLFTDPRQ